MVVDAVPGAQDFGVFADLHFEVAADDIVEFLTFVGVGMDGTVLFFGFVFVADPVGFSDFLTEAGGEMDDFDAVLIDGGLAAAGSRYGIGFQLGAAAFQQVGNIETEGQSAFMDKRKGQILLGVFVGDIFLGGRVGKFCHILNAEIGNFAHLPDTAGDLCQFTVGGIHHFFLFSFHLPDGSNTVFWGVFPVSWIPIIKKNPVSVKQRDRVLFLKTLRYHSSCRISIRPLRIHQSLCIDAAITGSVY